MYHSYSTGVLMSIFVVSSVAIKPNEEVHLPEEAVRITDFAVETNTRIVVPAGRRKHGKKFPLSSQDCGYSLDAHVITTLAHSI